MTDPYAPMFNRRTLDLREVAAMAPLPWDLPGNPYKWTPEEVGFVRDEVDRAYIRLRGLVYAENLGESTRTIPVTVTFQVTVPVPGPRVWWAPWRRHPDTYHTQEVTRTTEVDVTRTTWAKVPDAPPFPPSYGRPVRFVDYDAAQANWRRSEGHPRHDR
jgi:hypothetical protein